MNFLKIQKVSNNSWQKKTWTLNLKRSLFFNCWSSNQFFNYSNLSEKIINVLVKVLKYFLKYFQKMYSSTSKSTFEKKYSSTSKSTSTLYSSTYFVLKYRVLYKSAPITLQKFLKMIFLLLNVTGVTRSKRNQNLI